LRKLLKRELLGPWKKKFKIRKSMEDCFAHIFLEPKFFRKRMLRRGFGGFDVLRDVGSSASSLSPSEKQRGWPLRSEDENSSSFFDGSSFEEESPQEARIRWTESDCLVFGMTTWRRREDNIVLTPLRRMSVGLIDWQKRFGLRLSVCRRSRVNRTRKKEKLFLLY